MTYPFFPTLPGQGYSVIKAPLFSTRVSSHVSGREVRVANWAHTLYQFEVLFNGLDSSGSNFGLQAYSLQKLMGFYVQQQGQFLPFLYADPTDDYAGNAVFATGDGTTTAFTLERPMGGYSEPSSYVTSIALVTSNGAAVASSAYTLTPPNTITFTTAPTSGASLAASFNYAFFCRFVSDSAEFENFMSGLWSVKSLKFRSIR